MQTYVIKLTSAGLTIVDSLGIISVFFFFYTSYSTWILFIYFIRVFLHYRHSLHEPQDHLRRRSRECNSRFISVLVHHADANIIVMWRYRWNVINSVTVCLADCKYSFVFFLPSSTWLILGTTSKHRILHDFNIVHGQRITLLYMYIRAIIRVVYII